MSDFEQWLKEELDDLSHGVAFTCDRQGDIASGRRESRREALVEAAEEYGLGYEHEPETCGECQELREFYEEDSLLDLDEEEIQETLEGHGVSGYDS